MRQSQAVQEYASENVDQWAWRVWPDGESAGQGRPSRNLLNDLRLKRRAEEASGHIAGMLSRIAMLSSPAE
jgi:hypothetical protein